MCTVKINLLQYLHDKITCHKYNYHCNDLLNFCAIYKYALCQKNMQTRVTFFL